MNATTKRVLNYCKLNPESVGCVYFIKSIEDSKKIKSEERKLWRLVRDDLLSISKESAKSV